MKKKSAAPVAVYRSILLVEDDLADFQFAKYHLKKRKLLNPVRSVAISDELMAYLEGTWRYSDRHKYPAPAVIIIDQHLPELNGLDMQSMVRVISNYRHIPIIAISDAARLPLLKAAVELGAAGYLTKPFDTQQFLDLARKLHLPLHFDK